MPPSFFTCFELRHLILQNCSIHAQPSLKGFDRLISLELRDVAISSKLLERLISCSLLLEQLVLQISGAASNLSLPHREYYAGAGKCNIAKFFESFSPLEHLHLNAMEQVKYQRGFPTIFIVFPNLQSLEIKVECDDNDIPALESLEVERFSDVTFNHLREVKLMQTNGTIPEIQLMKLLLTKSPELMKIIIEPCVVEESETVKILTELIQFQRASTKAEVVYKLDNHPNPGPV
ncbi:hypothetical protein RDI58_012357 [Solanum bulbocastanum]|uniref:F-box/LRR-repeat protein 15/At3g58940/PEG3-like LRR domain-containing protein n=1 Tax=Solanum bulbocastanum TaxID=147425 RepID=A0AAN8YD15_SOLBU